MSTARYLPQYTYEDYLQWEGDWELWFGTAIAMTPSPFGAHERVVNRLATQLSVALDAICPHCRVYSNLDWVAANDTVVRPDVMVVCGEQPDRHLEYPPVLAAEVLSPSTAQRDRDHKLPLYAQFGVPHFLILDPDAKTCDRFELKGKAYEAVDENWLLRFEKGCDVSLDIDDLFR